MHHILGLTRSRAGWVSNVLRAARPPRALLPSVIVCILGLGCGQEDRDDQPDAGQPSSSAAPSPRFVGAVAEGVPSGLPLGLGNDVIQVVVRLDEPLSSVARRESAVTVNGVRSENFYEYGSTRACYSADVAVYGPPLTGLRPGQSLEVGLVSGRRSRARTTVRGRERVSRSAVRELGRSIRCSPPPAEQTHPVLRVKASGVTRRAHLVCYGDETERIRDSTGCGRPPRLEGDLEIRRQGQIRVLVRGALDDLDLMSSEPPSPGTHVSASLRPRRIGGGRREWVARVPGRLRSEPDYLVARMDLPRGAFAYYELGVRLAGG